MLRILGGALFAMWDPSSQRLRLISCVFPWIPGNQIVMCSSAITEKGLGVCIKGSFIHQVESLLRQPAGFERGTPLFSTGFPAMVADPPKGTDEAARWPAEGHCGPPCCTDRKHTCAALGRWSKGWSHSDVCPWLGAFAQYMHYKCML